MHEMLFHGKERAKIEVDCLDFDVKRAILGKNIYTYESVVNTFG
jgi:hypothetical protein